MTLNAYLLVQAGVATAAAIPPGMSTGEWVALASFFVVMAGVVYRAGVASQKAQSVESLVTKELQGMSEKLDTLLDAQIDRARFEENIEGRVSRLEGKPVHIHQRANDR
jgi:enolase